MPARIREIVYDDRFLADLYSLEGNPQIADEFLEGAEYVLSREPRLGTQIFHGSPVWFLPIADILRLPPLSLFYTFDDHHVFFLSLKISHPGA